MKYKSKYRLFKTLLWGVTFVLAALGQGLLQFANAQSRHSWEILVVNERAAGNITVRLTNNATSAYQSVLLHPSEDVDMTFNDTSGTFIGEPNTLYTIKIDNYSTQFEYTYFYCIPASLDDEDLFFCPNDEGGSIEDLYMYVDTSVRIEPFSLIPAGDLDIDDYFTDSNWIAPYNFDTYCAESEGSCEYWKVSFFLTPQVSSSTFLFTDKNLTQPSDRVWDFNNVTLTLPDSRTLHITEGLNIDGSSVTFGESSTIIFEDNSTMIYDGDEFNVEAGTTFRMGDDVRFTFESAITLEGANGDEITFEAYENGDQWDYIDLKDDGNDFDYVIFDGGYKTVEVRSTGNTFNNVTFSNGWRGISSNYDTVSGRSAFTLTDCTVTGNSATAVVAYHSNFTLDDTTVEESGEAGVWINDATTTSFVDNLIQSSALTSTTRSGIEVGAAGILSAGDGAYNVIINNTYHEISSSSSGQIDVGTYSGGMTGGYNDIYDEGTQAVLEKYIYEGSSYDAMAEKNCWNTTSEPSASFFSGSVDYDFYISCDRSSKRAPEASGGYSIRDRILDARDIVVKSAPFYRNGDVASLYMMQQLDRADALGERAQTMSVIGDVRDINAANLGEGPSVAKERAILIGIHDALTNERYMNASDLVISDEKYVKSRTNLIELLLSKVFLLEYDRSYEKALRVLAAARLLAKSEDGLAPSFEIIEGAIVDRIEDITGVRVDASQYAAVDIPTLREVTTPSSSESEAEKVSDLLSVYPNPFNPTTTIPFKLATRSKISILIFDLLGRQVALLADGMYEAGNHSVVFEAGNRSSGSYILQFRSNPENGPSTQVSRLLTLQK